MIVTLDSSQVADAFIWLEGDFVMGAADLLYLCVRIL